MKQASLNSTKHKNDNIKCQTKEEKVRFVIKKDNFWSNFWSSLRFCVQKTHLSNTIFQKKFMKLSGGIGARKRKSYNKKNSFFFTLQQPQPFLIINFKFSLPLDRFEISTIFFELFKWKNLNCFFWTLRKAHCEGKVTFRFLFDGASRKHKVKNRENILMDDIEVEGGSFVGGFGVERKLWKF